MFLNPILYLDILSMFLMTLWIIMGFLGGLLSATSENVADLACVGKMLFSVLLPNEPGKYSLESLV